MARRRPLLFRPKRGIDHGVLTQNRRLVEAIDRRGALRGALSLGALTLLTGCDVTEDDSVHKALRTVSAWNDRVQAALFRPNHLAPTFAPSQVVKPPRFNAHFDVDEVKPIDGATWSLQLTGLIADKRPWTAQEIYQLPEQEIIIRHICVEGWDYIGQWSGPNLKAFLERRPFSPPNMPARR
jgi:DMSO/TMAO reductase YedYZ molybdopterin-dependent catalytic subunit